MDRKPSLLIDPSLEPSPVRAALVWASGLSGCPPTQSVPGFLQEVLDRVRAGEAQAPADGGEARAGGQEVRAGGEDARAARNAAVRNMLRHGACKPAGRSKPASEYLRGAAAASRFPLVNGPVDVTNAVSLQWGYPASIFDAARSGWELLLRRGRAGESYAFNSSGQTIELNDLLCVCRKAEGAWVPCGSPVKDSMATKITPATTDVVAVIFSPAEEPPGELRRAAERLAGLLSAHCHAAETGFELV